MQRFYIFLIFSTICLMQIVMPCRPAKASDSIIKYYIFSMETPKDKGKIVSFISGFEGVSEVETRLERHWVYVSFDDDLLQDERESVRKPLKQMGYPVDRWEMLLEKPESHE